MNFKMLFSISIFFLIYNISYGQDCDCESNFQWVKTTFEENDAGFQYIIDRKGQQAYDIHNAIFADKIKSANNLMECTDLLYEWLTFFRSGHIGIEMPKYGAIPNHATRQTEAFYGEIENPDITGFKKYIEQKTEADYEGIWEIGAYRIGIRKDGDGYIGFIIDSEADEWTKGQIKLRIIKEGGKYKSVFYLRNHQPEEYDKVELIGNTHLQIGWNILKRISPSFPKENVVENHIKYLSARNPYLDDINGNTLLLRIPSFGYDHKKMIDSVILSNRDKILSTENLIIDLRNNGGGSDQSFSELIPFLYTNPIRTVGVQFLSTRLNNEMMLDYATNLEYGFDEETKKWARESYDKMQQHLNEFVDIFPDTVSIDELDTIYPYPKKIAILINKGNASTVEQFLLAAKQSKKVKLFGVTTGGALDISNMNVVESPCKQFRLWYCMSKSHRIPGMTIDDIGIQPDFYIDNTIPDYQWVKFTTEILEMK